MNKIELLKNIEEYIRNKDFAKARKLIRNDLKRIGSRYEYYFYLGVASIDAKERLKNFEKALEIQSDNLEVIVNYANALDELGKFKEAIKEYDKALFIDSKDALIYNNRGYSYFHLKDFENAMKDYNKALTLAPKLKIARQNKDELLKLISGEIKYSDVVKIAEEIYKDFEYYLNLGISELRQNHRDETVSALNKVLEIKPDCAEAYLFLGVLNTQNEEFLQAKNFYSKAIEINPKMTDAYFNRGQIVFGTNTENDEELKSALQDFIIATELSPKFIDAHYSAAVLYKKMGEYKNAIKSLDKILVIDNQSVNAKALKKLIENKYL